MRALKRNGRLDYFARHRDKRYSFVRLPELRRDGQARHHEEALAIDSDFTGFTARPGPKPR